MNMKRCEQKSTSLGIELGSTRIKAVLAGPDGSVGGLVDELVTGSVGEAAGSAGLDPGSIDAAY